MSTPRRRRPVRGSGPPSGTEAVEILAWLTAGDDPGRARHDPGGAGGAPILRAGGHGLSSSTMPRRAAPAGSREKCSIHATSRPGDADGAVLGADPRQHPGDGLDRHGPGVDGHEQRVERRTGRGRRGADHQVADAQGPVPVHLRREQPRRLQRGLEPRAVGVVVVVYLAAMSVVFALLSAQNADFVRTASQTEGTVVALVARAPLGSTREAQPDARTPSLAPKVTYEVAGRTYDYVAAHGRARQRLQVGDRVTVLYAPADPTKARLRGEGLAGSSLPAALRPNRPALDLPARSAPLPRPGRSLGRARPDGAPASSRICSSSSGCLATSPDGGLTSCPGDSSSGSLSHAR